MPRHNRVKHLTFIYHVMVRSISEVPLFKDDDGKDKYLRYVQKYQEQLSFKVYGYCLMTKHGHFIIDANGSDISKVMLGINLSYATHYNIKHKRHGIFSRKGLKVRLLTTTTTSSTGHIHTQQSNRYSGL